MNEAEALEIGKKIYKKHFYNIGEKVREKDFISYVVAANIALERQNEKKPTVDEFDYGNGYVCGVCESFLHYVDDDDEHIRTNYCCHCGQKIDWS